MKYAYIDNTGVNTTMFHTIIMEAIANGGVFNDDFSDMFVLIACPAGSAAGYSLQFA